MLARTVTKSAPLRPRERGTKKEFWIVLMQYRAGKLLAGVLALGMLATAGTADAGSRHRGSRKDLRHVFAAKASASRADHPYTATPPRRKRSSLLAAQEQHQRILRRLASGEATGDDQRHVQGLITGKLRAPRQQHVKTVPATLVPPTVSAGGDRSVGERIVYGSAAAAVTASLVLLHAMPPVDLPPVVQPSSSGSGQQSIPGKELSANFRATVSAPEYIEHRAQFSVTRPHHEVQVVGAPQLDGTTALPERSGGMTVSNATFSYDPVRRVLTIDSEHVPATAEIRYRNKAPE